jgi:electron transport complex protein RnfB
MTAVAVGLVIAGFTGWLLAFAQRRWQHSDSDLVNSINAVLPQTQCAQCGYPGCLPYARAIAACEAPLNLCPPGGKPTHEALIRLLPDHDAGDTPSEPAPVTACIDESRCIGCYLCIPVCPVDAIVGAKGLMHTVLTKECTGCGLCVAPCPVDCIELKALVTP